MSKSKDNVKQKMQRIKAFAFDLDGVLTDGGMYVFPGSAEPLRKMSIKDGYALHITVKFKWPVIIISGSSSEPARQRLSYLGVKEIYMKVPGKKDCLNSFLQKYNLKAEEVLYMGDDIPDLEVMEMAGVSACPYDAVPEVLSCSDYVSPYKGGEGCVRDVIRQVLKLNGQWPEGDHKEKIPEDK